jgi:hypothetical protein
MILTSTASQIEGYWITAYGGIVQRQTWDELLQNAEEIEANAILNTRFDNALDVDTLYTARALWLGRSRRSGAAPKLRGPKVSTSALEQPMKSGTAESRSQTPLVPIERIERMILFVRGQKAMLDRDFAQLYQVETRALLQAVKRNLDRFQAHFMFQLTPEEFVELRSQFVTSSWGGRRYLPYAFTEQGVPMLSCVLHSRRAVQVNIEIVRAFVRLRRLADSSAELRRSLDELEKKYDAQFNVVFEVIRKLMQLAPVPSKRRIGFSISEE